MKALIDGDIPVYTECASTMKRGNPFGDYFADIEKLTQQVIDVCDAWTEEAGADSTVFIHGHQSRRNYRKHLLPGQYKAGRSEKPDGYSEVLEAVIEHYDSFAIDGIEGDDTLGILHSSDTFGETVVVSTDKDMKTIPGWLYNPMKMVQREWITTNAANHFRYWQVLVGDSADGYKGCPKIGPVKANKALGEFPDDTMGEAEYEAQLWRGVRDLYLEVYPGDDQESEEAAIMQMRMARILHRQDYDQESGQIKLWHPSEDVWLGL